MPQEEGEQADAHLFSPTGLQVLQGGGVQLQEEACHGGRPGTGPSIKRPHLQADRETMTLYNACTAPSILQAVSQLRSWLT